MQSRQQATKLNADELDLLKELTDHSEKWRALLRAMDVALQNMANDVLDYNLSKGPEGLVLAKARLEGARDLKQAIESLKPKANGAGLR